MNSMKCSCCGASDQPHKMVTCNICKKDYKIDCVDISNAEARKIHAKTSGLSWSCSSCAQLGDDLNALKSAIVALQEEVKTLKCSYQAATSNTFSPIEFERVVQEVTEREHRKPNVIIYGCVESDCNSNREQIDLDKALVNDVLSHVGLVDEKYTLTRLGKFNPNSAEPRRRPLRVTLSSAASASVVLKRSKELRGLPGWSALAFSRDRTQLERDVYRGVRKELDERSAGGETGLTIAYRNGIPTIINSVN